MVVGDYVERLIDNGVSEISFHIDTVNRQIFRLMNILEKAKVGVGMVINRWRQWTAPICPGTLGFGMRDDSGPRLAGQPFIPEMLKKSPC